MFEKFRIEFRWSSIFTAISIVWVYAEKYLGLHDTYIEYHSIVSLVLLIPFALSIYMCLRAKKETIYKGNMSWQKAFVSGALLSLLVAALSIGTTYVMVEYVSPKFFEIAIQKSVAQGADKDMIQQFFNLNAYISQGIMFYLAFGVMISAILALLLKSKT